MTVRDAVNVMTNAEIRIVWEGLIIPFDTDNTLMADAYGDYKVKAIHSGYREDKDKECFELHIAMQPIKEART